MPHLRVSLCPFWLSAFPKRFFSVMFDGVFVA